MNYLAHAFFSGDDPQILVGNMIGDFVKGISALETFPETIKKGIEWHRALDDFTDNHIAVARAKNYFRPEYGLYSGAFVDVMLDHFLANDPRFFSTEKELLTFTQTVYQTLEKFKEILPNQYLQMLEYMERENWLYAVRTVKGLDEATQRLVRRMKYENNSSTAYQIIMRHYYELNQIYYDFVADVDNFVKIKLIQKP